MNQAKEYLIDPAEGKTIYEILKSKGVFLDAPCAGRGTCGKCLVYAFGEMTPLTAEECRVLSKAEIEAGARLSCQTIPLGQCRVCLTQKGEINESTAYTITVQAVLFHIKWNGKNCQGCGK